MCGRFAIFTKPEAYLTQIGLAREVEPCAAVEYNQIAPVGLLSRQVGFVNLSYHDRLMKTKYEKINELHRKVNEIGRAELLEKIPGLLESWGIKRRADDGDLTQINITKPEGGLLVIGLRYLKKDETFTEDVFEFSSLKPNDISKYYKGKYERERTEYKGTHKQQNIFSLPFTSVNTCSYFTGNKNDS